jgi:hypothetical protein
MSYNSQLQSNNIELENILEIINNLPNGGTNNENIKLEKISAIASGTYTPTQDMTSLATI